MARPGRLARDACQLDCGNFWLAGSRTTRTIDTIRYQNSSTNSGVTSGSGVAGWGELLSVLQLWWLPLGPYNHLSTAPLRQCIAGTSTVGSEWNATRRGKIASAFLGLDDPLASKAWDRSAGVLDTYASAWVAVYEDTCADSHGAASPVTPVV